MVADDGWSPSPATSPPALWKKVKPLAREKRREPTAAEEIVWQQVRNRRTAGAKFRRQHAVERFIVDFYCADARLIVEIDGPIHDYTPEEDAIRQEYLESLGFRVLRFTNDDVFHHLNIVLDALRSALSSGSDSTSSPSPPRGEGAGG